MQGRTFEPAASPKQQIVIFPSNNRLLALSPMAASTSTQPGSDAQAYAKSPDVIVTGNDSPATASTS